MLAPACENKAKKNDVHAAEEMKNWKPLTALSQSQATGGKEKENEEKNSTSSLFPLFPYMVSHVCVCADIAQNELHSILAGGAPAALCQVQSASLGEI